MSGKVVPKGSTLNEEVIDILNYWFGIAYWNAKVINKALSGFCDKTVEDSD